MLSWSNRHKLVLVESVRISTDWHSVLGTREQPNNLELQAPAQKSGMGVGRLCICWLDISKI